MNYINKLMVRVRESKKGQTMTEYVLIKMAPSEHTRAEGFYDSGERPSLCVWRVSVRGKNARREIATGVRIEGAAGSTCLRSAIRG